MKSNTWWTKVFFLVWETYVLGETTYQEYNNKECRLYLKTDVRVFKTDYGWKDCKQNCPPYQNSNAYPNCHVCCFGDNIHNVNGSWSEWTTWTRCSSTCGNGMKTRIRACSSPRPSGNGSLCKTLTGGLYDADQQTNHCIIKSCPQEVCASRHVLFGIIPLVLLLIAFLIGLAYCWRKERFCFNKRCSAVIQENYNGDGNLDVTFVCAEGSGTA